MHADRSIYGGIYDLPAVPLNGDPAILVVDDKVQRDEGPFSLGQGGRRVQIENPVWGHEIASDIVRQWAESGLGMTPECRPGIWVVRDVLPDIGADGIIKLDIFRRQIFLPASERQSRDMWEQDVEFNRRADRRYAEYCFTQGNAWAGEPRLIPFMPKNYIMAARQYGFEAIWMKEGSEQVSPCPWCTTVIPKVSIVCPKCTQVINFEAFAIMEAKKQRALERAQDTIHPPTTAMGLKPKAQPQQGA